MIVDLSDDALVRLRVNKTRLKSTESIDLVQAHREVGKAIARAFAEHLSIEEYPIEHVTGLSTGFRIQVGREPIILALLRAGLFLAEGIRESIPGSSLVLLDGHEKPLPTMPALDRPLLLVDGVINTGTSIRPLIDKALATGARNVLVAALVAHRPGLEDLARDYPQVDFLVARVSDHGYLGRGGTDTGARLFGTTTWSTERS
ncbi:MAG: uracil phosphoribosyltransferase [Thermoplasmata archaeon]